LIDCAFCTSVAEYACPVRHSSLTVDESGRTKSIQRHALRSILMTLHQYEIVRMPTTVCALIYHSLLMSSTANCALLYQHDELSQLSTISTARHTNNWKLSG